MSDILTTIAEYTKERVRRAKEEKPLEKLK